MPRDMTHTPSEKENRAFWEAVAAAAEDMARMRRFLPPPDVKRRLDAVRQGAPAPPIDSAPAAIPADTPSKSADPEAPTPSPADPLPQTADGRRAAVLREMYPRGRPALKVRDLQADAQAKGFGATSLRTFESALYLAWPIPQKNG
jgi:hypothetical protein